MSSAPPEGLEEWTRLQRQLVGLWVHDLRNPVAALSANLSFIRSAVGADPDLGEALDDCTLCVEVIIRLADNLLVQHRLEAAEVLGSQPAPLHSVVEQVVTKLARHARPADLEIAFVRSPRDVRVANPGGLLGLAIENLVSCGLSHAPARSVVTVKVEIEEGLGVVSVLDRGGAVDARLHDVVVTRSGQIEAKSAEGGRYGRGLGLYVANLVARAAGGSVRVGVAPDGQSLTAIAVPSSGSEQPNSAAR